jgi:hypothetical protein
LEGVGDKISIAEVRARRTDPAWRRRHQLADIAGATLVLLLVVVPPTSWVLSPPVGALVLLVLLVGAAGALWWRGPRVGLERRTALLVAIPVVNLVILVPAVWRAAHLHLQRWRGPLDPRWDDTTWRVAGAVAVVLWLALLAGVVLTMT